MSDEMPDELSLLIEKLVYGGDGLAHADGDTVFVPYVLPGEEARATIRQRKKKLVWADLQKVISASAQRTKPACPHFGICGGCHYQHIYQQEQVRLKKEILRETLSRIGGIAWTGPIIEHSAEPYGYRNRAQWAVRSGMPRALGYYLPESSTIVPIDTCPVLSPLLSRAFRELQNLVRAGSLPEEMNEIEAFADSSDTKIALNVALSSFTKPAAELAKQFQAAVPQIESLLLLDQKKNRFELTGPGFLTHETAGFRFRVGHLSFFQVNRFLLEELLKTVAANSSGELALDLYAGVGFFSLPLAKTFQRVVAVDANLAATRDLQANAEDAGLPVVLHNLHVEEFLNAFREKPDFVILDPPRTGLGTSAAAKLAGLSAPEIAYLSCDPSTLARDLAVLTHSSKLPKDANPPGARYEITEIHFFDLFPQTYHIEAFVRLRLAP